MFENIRIIYTQCYDDIDFYKDLEDLKKKSIPYPFTIIYEDMSEKRYGIEELIELGLVIRELKSEREIIEEAQENVKRVEEALMKIYFREDPNKPLMITGGWPRQTTVEQEIIDIKRNLKLSWS